MPVSSVKVVATSAKNRGVNFMNLKNDLPSPFIPSPFSGRWCARNLILSAHQRQSVYNQPFDVIGSDRYRTGTQSSVYSVPTKDEIRE